MSELLSGEELRLLERLSLADIEALLAGVTGERTGRARTPGIEFADYRAYAPGDDLRAIDWNAWARLHELQVKTAPVDGRLRLALLVDTSASMDWGEPSKLRHALRLAAALGALALLRGDAVQVHAMTDGDAEPGRVNAGRGALGALLDELERRRAGRTTDLAGSFRALLRDREPADVAVLIGDLLGGSDALADLQLAGRTAAVLHVVHPDEARPRLRGAVDMRDAETGERIALTVDRGVRARYAELFEARAAALAAECERHGVRYIRAPVELAPIDLLAGPLRAARLVG